MRNDTRLSRMLHVLIHMGRHEERATSEVRVCLTKDLAFAGCPRSVKTQCRDGDIRIPAQR